MFESCDKGDSQVWCTRLTLHRGKHYIIEAESGAGKSSLCAFLTGERNDYKGTILFDGADISHFSQKDWTEVRRHEIALLPQEMRLFPELTVLENIELKNSLTKHYSKQRIIQMLERLEIDNKADTYASRLSIGQMQRVAIIRSLCQPFSFLLLDEPVSHLDERNNRMAARLITDAADEQGASIVVTSVGNRLLLETDFSNIKL